MCSRTCSRQRRRVFQVVLFGALLNSAASAMLCRCERDFVASGNLGTCWRFESTLLADGLSGRCFETPCGPRYICSYSIFARLLCRQTPIDSRVKPNGPSDPYMCRKQRVPYHLELVPYGELDTESVDLPFVSTRCSTIGAGRTCDAPARAPFKLTFDGACIRTARSDSVKEWSGSFGIRAAVKEVSVFQDPSATVEARRAIRVTLDNGDQCTQTAVADGRRLYFLCAPGSRAESLTISAPGSPYLSFCGVHATGEAVMNGDIVQPIS